FSAAKTLRVLHRFSIDVDLFCGSQSALFDASGLVEQDIMSSSYAKGCYAPLAKSKIAALLPTSTASSYLSEGLGFLILSGRYLGFLPRRYAANWVSNGEMKALLPAVYSHRVELSVVVRKGETLGPVLETFLESFGSFTDV
ncbi:MAG: hypothetical protein ACPG4U_14035, partial [Pseudomonadales bacterium]